MSSGNLWKMCRLLLTITRRKLCCMHAQEIASLKSACATLKDEVNLQRQKNLQLERYTRRGNIRLLYVEEKDDEDTEELFIRCLTEMNVYDPQMRFHTVHRVGQLRKRKGGPNVTQARDILLPDSSAARTEILSGRTERKSRKLNISKMHSLCRIYASKMHRRDSN